MAEQTTNNRLLQQLRQQELITGQQYQAISQQPYTAWWLEVLTALAAWIASLFMLSAFGSALFLIGDDTAVRLIVAVMLLAGCVFLSRQPQDFMQQMAVAFSLAGQALILWTVNDTMLLTDKQLFLLALVQAAIMLFLPLNAAHRWLCGIIILISLHLALASMLLVVTAYILLTGVAIVLWLSRAYWAGHRFSPLIKPVTEILTLYSLLAASFSQDYFSARYHSWWWMDYHPYIPAIYQYGSMLLLFGCVCWLSRNQPIVWRLTVAATAIVFMVLLQNAPGMLLSTSLLLATFYGCSKRWFRASLLFMLLYLSEFYYSLHITLLQKSGILLGSGVLLLMLFMLLNYYQRRNQCPSG
ncbi:DUF4401 domain-containing protein [Chromatiaceae bacterium AAb-1]|nr:DUF4401 domain-containing protein [Chromatiaceae bacterium AAb-1]